ncbi:pentatricopeptide repeat-containing protein At2g03880, mitochondrial-like [Apium graveolens]|uniref:pentatricopeptide repeat-containing protein At2g03880, mitochondrial-like n=1 Tax=Apium graveolens TaxID=4045 RepID=UPI003D7AB898
MRISKLLPSWNTRHFCTSISTTNLNYTINCYILDRNVYNARKLFDQNPSTRNVVSWNSMISGYVKNNQMAQAQQLFDEMPERDIVSWNTMLSGFHKAGNPEKVYILFSEMVRVGLRPTEFTFSTVVRALISTRLSVLITQLHGHIICSAFNLDFYVGSALMRAYTDVRDAEGMRRVFDEISLKEASVWNGLILGFMDIGQINESQRAFDMMPVRNVVSWTILVNGYINNGRLDEARLKFDMMTEKNVFSWTAMIKGYVQYGNFLYAFELFVSMLRLGPYPNQFTLSSVLEACAGSSSLMLGNQVHSCILKSGIPCDVILLTSLVDMYAKCGDIEAAHCIFESMPKKNVASWNSIIGGYARHGIATRALQEFERMKNVGVKPDKITFINVLSACGHGGLVEEGEGQFADMEMKYGIQAEKEHYACMVDLFGKAGQLEKAEKLIKEMPFKPDVVIWGALIGACGLYSRLELGEFAAKELSSLEQDHPAVYIMLSRIHNDKDVWDSVKRSKKQKACSWVDSSCTR